MEDIRWKPEIACLKLDECQDFDDEGEEVPITERQRKLMTPVFTGEKVFATNGHLMAVFPSKEEKGEKYDGKLNYEAVIPDEEGKLKISLDPFKLIRLLNAIGYDERIPGITLVLSQTNRYSPIKVKIRADQMNGAFGVIMPMRLED